MAVRSIPSRADRTHICNDPKGIFITTTLVVAFNPEYLTKIDRVYVIQCYYMEMQNKLEKQISVSMAPPPLQTQQVPMPVCRYEVLDGSPEGPPVFYAKIGQMVYHKWTCDAQTDNQFCMKVHSCTVDDGNGDRVELIDSDGCAKDKYLLQNLDYVSDLMVGKEAHVYKYADRQSMFFDCQITLTVKEPGEQYCDVPQCPDPPRRRRTSQNATLASSLAALRTLPTAVEPEAKESEPEELPTNFIINPEQTQKTMWIGDHFTISQDSLCMSPFGVSSLTTVNLILMGASGILFWNAFRVVKSLN
uniref:ZP domain-containing protein n=1 Tax=Panagrellus redivivus TaxID=6233 RepID=A0A7E4W316_PANRE